MIKPTSRYNMAAMKSSLFSAPCEPKKSTRLWKD